MLPRSLFRLFARTRLRPVYSLSLLLVIFTISIVLAPMMITNQSIVGTVFSCLMIIGLVQAQDALTENSGRVRFWLRATGIAIIILRILTEVPAAPQWLVYCPKLVQTRELYLQKEIKVTCGLSILVKYYVLHFSR